MARTVAPRKVTSNLETNLDWDSAHSLMKMDNRYCTRRKVKVANPNYTKGTSEPKTIQVEQVVKQLCWSPFQKEQLSLAFEVAPEEFDNHVFFEVITYWGTTPESKDKEKCHSVTTEIKMVPVVAKN